MEEYVRSALERCDLDAERAREWLAKTGGANLTPPLEDFLRIRGEMAVEAFRKAIERIPVPELANRIHEAYVAMGTLKQYLTEGDEMGVIREAQASYQALNPKPFMGMDPKD